MIIRKPYAFLIKNFNKIHIVLFLLASFVFYKTMSLSSFMNDFVQIEIYNEYVDPISNYIGIFVFIAALFMVVVIAAIILLLIRKKKPWIAYVIVLIEYILLILVFGTINSYFSGYTVQLDSATALALKDILFIVTIPQYGVFILLIIRSLGIDVKRFDFKNDSEFLELDSDDREEIEIKINIDSYSFKRKVEKFKREFGYFFKEHKFIVSSIFILVIVVISAVSYNYFFVVHKTYSEKEILETERYEIIINKSYITDKSLNGELIEVGKKFVIIDATVKNKLNKVDVNLDKFHVMTSEKVYSKTENTYSNYFSDLGKVYTELTLDTNQSQNVLFVYKVDDKKDVDNYAFYYQDYTDEGSSYVRRVKIEPKEVETIENDGMYKLGEEMVISLPTGEKKELMIDNYEFHQEVSYNFENCPTADNCYITDKIISVTDNFKILKIDFSSTDFTGKELIDFSTDYGTIGYKDANGKLGNIDFHNLALQNYYGKYLYVKVPNELITSEEIQIVYTVRDKEYIYQLK